jgi:hypothetical protein
MAHMNEERLARFEANIERLIENAFTAFFGQKVRAQDIALQLARAMEEYAMANGAGEPTAPDHYVIRLNPHIHAHLNQYYPSLSQSLGQHMLILATQTGYQLNNVPLVECVADPALDKAQVFVTARHTPRPHSSTAGLQRVQIPAHDDHQIRAHLIINSDTSIPLEEEIINIGRQRDNDIVLSDIYVSRHHLQLRRRFGTYHLFDVQSRGGTVVNGVMVKEHRLQSGDVIDIGRSRLIYMEDSPPDDAQLSQTDSLEPLF